ncbi:MAG: hypothetical protein K6E29_03410, partial [Cyanobacteria bacterium RUI128]|nr:hypothetical protein [Cyanobacteria bacterium RUI128]
MAKVRTITKKLKNTDDYEFVPETPANTNYKIYASANGNKIYDAGGNDSLYGGNGDDTLIATEGNDTLSGGKGGNTLTISGAESGNDTILLGKGTDHLTFDQSDSFAYSKSGNDLIISHKVGDNNNGQVTVKNYFKYAEDAASLKDLAYGGNEARDLNALINEAGLTLTNVTSKNKKIAGTYLSDVIEAQGKTNNTITTGKGDDTITAGLGKDTIKINDTGIKTIKIA